MIGLLLYLLMSVVLLYLLLAVEVSVVQRWVPVKWKAVLNAITLILVVLLFFGAAAAGYVHFRPVL